MRSSRTVHRSTVARRVLVHEMPYEQREDDAERTRTCRYVEFSISIAMGTVSVGPDLRLTMNDQGDDESGDGILTGTLEHSQTGDDTGIWMVSGHRIRVTNQTKIVRNGHSLHKGADLRVSGHGVRTVPCAPSGPW